MTPFTSALSVVDDVHRLLLAEQSAEQRDELAKGLFSITAGTRWNLMSTETNIVELWEVIRTDELVTDYIVRATSMFMCRFGYIPADLDRVIGHCSSGLGWVTGSGIVDDALRERSGHSEWFGRVFKSEQWVLYLYLLSFVRQV